MMKNINKGNFKKTVVLLKMVHKVSKGYILNVLILSILQSILPFISLIFSYLILDLIIEDPTSSKLILYVSLLISLNLVVGLLINYLTYRDNKLAIGLEYNLDNAIARKGFSLDFDVSEDTETLRLIEKAREGSNSNGGIAYYIYNLFTGLFSSILTIIYSISLLSTLIFSTSNNIQNSFLEKLLRSPLSFLIIVFFIALSCVISLIILKIANKMSYKTMLENVESNRRFFYFYNICSNYNFGKDIRIYGMKDMIIKEMSSSKYSVATTWRKYSLFQARTEALITLFSYLLSFVSYTYVGLKAYYGYISIGSIISYVGAITLLSSAIGKVISSYVTMSLMNTYLENYFLFLNLDTFMDYGDEIFDLSKPFEIEFKNVSFHYPHIKEYIIKNLNLKIGKGQKLAIVGMNGAGKTTLIKLLTRLYQPTGGEILINGKNIKDYTRDSIRDLYSVVFQDFKLFSYSIKNNITIGSSSSDEKVKEALRKAGILDRVESMKDGINTIIYNRNEENGVEISGGEAQKLAIARALFKDAPIVILDEPTAALDPKSEAEIYERFKELVEHKTSIFISHRMSSCKFCDEIIVMDNGIIEEKGTHQELLSNNGLYKKMWDAQAQYYKD